MPTTECRQPECSRPTAENQRCSTHARTWRNHAQRCDLCGKIIEDPGTVRDFKDPEQQPKILGRSHLWEGGPLGIRVMVRLGRCCERWHLLKDGRTNRLMLSLHLGVDPEFPECWTWLGDCNSAGRPLFVPEGANKSSAWIAYRAVMALTQPHLSLKKNHVIDHTGCRAADGSNRRNIRCCNPLHLKPRTPGANQKRIGTRASKPIKAHATLGTMYIAVERDLPWALEPDLLEKYDLADASAELAELEMARWRDLRERGKALTSNL